MNAISGKDAFSARLEDMCRLAEKRGTPVFSAFLNEREQYSADKLLHCRNGIYVSFWGGDSACTRKILRVAADDGYGDTQEEYGDFPVYSLSVSYRSSDKPEHRALLGSFMALGIERETVGDIFVGDSAAAVFCTKTAHDMILGNIERVGRAGVKLSDGITGEAEKAVRPAAFRELTVNAASERADCIVSAVTGMSRERSAAFIRSGSFLLNYEPCTNISRNVSADDVLTIRGHGKFIISGEPETTKKGRLKIRIKKYD